MKKTYKIDVDCANCANLMEEAAKNTPGVKDAAVNFMALKMKVEFEDGAEPNQVMKNVQKLIIVNIQLMKMNVIIVMRDIALM